ncbi:MAG: amidase [Pseudomonadales bacterium]|jgi:amidase|nr:amidase [Pseudomonadales bacterium]
MIDGDPPVNPFVAEGRLRIEGALGAPLAPLTFAAKDLIDVAGTLTGGGNPDWARTHAPAPAHAPVIERLLEAGASLVGKTHTDELSRGILGRNAHYGTPLNPAAPERLPGGSSSGSAAAVAAGLADFALGTDTGGSVRIPAAFCGLFGLRTTHGRVSLDGVLGQAPSFDTLGWMARDAQTLDRVTAALLGEDHAFGRPTLLLVEDAWARADPAVAEVLRDALARLAPDWTRETLRLAEDGLDAWRDHQVVLQQREAWLSFADWIETVQPRLAWGVAVNFRAGAEHAPARLAEAVDACARIRERVRALLDGDRLLCLPTAPGPAPLRRIDGRAAAAAWPAIAPFTCIAGLSGAPQLTLPLATVEGAPVGLSFIGAPGRDQALTALARALTAAT